MNEDKLMNEDGLMSADKKMRKRANTYFFSKVVFNLFLIILGAVLISVCLRKIQMDTALGKQRENCELAISEVIDTLRSNEQDAAYLSEVFHEDNQVVLSDLWQLFTGGLSDSLTQSDRDARSKVFRDVVERSGADYLYLLSPDSRIILGPEQEHIGLNPAALSIMTQENINRQLEGTVLEDGTIRPVTVINQHGTYYFYSMPYTFQGVEYSLVLGTDASLLDVQIASLKDVSVVLSRAAVGNNGFLFAVDKTDNTFLYYKNGSEILTGQSALRAGLSEQALQDGYVGTEIIRGIRYYCVSRTFGDRTVICAVADTDTILQYDQYVIFWSTLGFVLVMLLCLAYAVVVRNDFVRRAVDTERLTLNPRANNPTYFDKSIFRKLFPLMLLGIFMIFGISFYTQTLLEITQGIERSSVALDEVSGREPMNTFNRDKLRNYYYDRFLSKARLISFLLEEDPSVLNEESDRYYSVFDEDRNRHFLTDDEGGHLRSVRSSARLQELCDANSIESVYIYDEDGRTIGTNASDWYRTISMDTEDPSSEFLQILSGWSDDYIQEIQTDEEGNNSQYIGTAFNYYTAAGEDGKAVYVSRFDYEHSGETAPDEEDAGKITAHRSLLQIGLNDSVSEKLLDSTDVGNILSTNILSGGFIVMFDATEDHLCVYSPNEPSIGLKAVDLGVSDKAFSGDDYYGFVGINGTDYFSNFRYLNGYFIGTALPLAVMYTTRLPIALVTSLISFLLILVLSFTVTLTNKEEEYLYQVMSEEQSEKGLNSVIFNIILPSGRNVSTVRAAARWDNRRVPWSERSPEQKLWTMIGAMLSVIVLYVLLTILGADRYFSDGSIVHYILNGSWDKGTNIFAVSSCAVVMLATAIGIYLFRIPVRLLTSLLGARGETVGHLLLSVVKYGGVLGAFFYCLYLLGIDSSSLLASAGILSLVIGLGAQSLIKDILAGIFIVFEGEYRVGDIVTISGYRGTVMDIGLRTTKIMGTDGNIKIFNNSEISGILNMTQEVSVAGCHISIEYGQDIDYVEEVLKRELPELRRRNDKILSGPDYLGVSELGDSGVDLLIICKCSEKDIKGVIRYLNKEVLKIFYRNEINVPFPNITVSQLDMTGRRTLEDLDAPEVPQKDV